MSMTKVVNGKRVQMTPAEISARKTDELQATSASALRQEADREANLIAEDPIAVAVLEAVSEALGLSVQDLKGKAKNAALSKALSKRGL